VNPFLSILTLLIQLPIILTLYWVFTRGGLPVIKPELLYSFVHIPAVISMKFLGLLNIQKRSIFLAVCAGLSQFASAHYSLRDQTVATTGTSFKDDMMKGMQLQMRFVLPGIIFLLGLEFAGAVALYWTVSNLFIVGQEIYLRHIGVKGPNKKKLEY
jgi:YidC/Oxa1 family membrane protein insertase